MPDELIPQLPIDEPDGNWLALHGKFVIIGGIVIVLAGAGLVTALYWSNRSGQTGTNLVANLNNNTAAVTNTAVNQNKSARPTFEQSTAGNVNTTPPRAYSLPTKNDLKKAIANLNNSSTSNTNTTK